MWDRPYRREDRFFSLSGLNRENVGFFFFLLAFCVVLRYLHSTIPFTTTYSYKYYLSNFIFLLLLLFFVFALFFFFNPSIYKNAINRSRKEVLFKRVCKSSRMQFRRNIYKKKSWSHQNFVYMCLVYIDPLGEEAAAKKKRSRSFC